MNNAGDASYSNLSVVELKNAAIACNLHRGGSGITACAQCVLARPWSKRFRTTTTPPLHHEIIARLTRLHAVVAFLSFIQGKRGQNGGGDTNDGSIVRSKNKPRV